MRKLTLPFLLALGLMACGPQGTKAPEKSNLGAEIIETAPAANPDPIPGECWASDITPAIIETVTEQKIVTAEVLGEDGTVIAPAVYSTTTKQSMVQDRTEIWFRAPCPDIQTPDFIATLQRALKARGYFLLPLTGVMDAATGEALRRFQAERGLDSPVLSLAAAKELGLISTAREDL